MQNNGELLENTTIGDSLEKLVMSDNGEISKIFVSKNNSRKEKYFQNIQISNITLNIKN